jgi:two-component system nitrogen regulation sensor histidine kinase NtrY
MRASQRRDWLRYGRQNRILVTAFVFLLLLSGAAVYLVQRTQAASPEELTNRLLLFVLWYLDISLILILSFILLRNIVRLALERRSGILGSRFRTKLVLTYVALTFAPAIFIFLVATNLLQRSIDRWFSSPVEKILRGGAEVTVQLRELVEERLERQAALAARELRSDPSPERLTRLQTLMGIDLIALYRGSHLVQAVAEPRRLPSSVPPLPWDDLPASGVRADRWRGGLLVRAWVPVVGGPNVVVVGAMLPRELLVHLERAMGADAMFHEMKRERGTVTATTILVFLAITLLLLFATVWIGLYLSRRLTEPLLAVAAATQRVAEGNQMEEVTVPASDEVGVLVHSFNAMVRRVLQTEREILASNQELATLLATIPTGVLTVSSDRLRFRSNPAAARMIGDSDWITGWHSIEKLTGPELEPIHRHLCAEGEVESSFQLDLESGGSARHLEIVVRPLPGGGSVVAMDDLTQLLRAQRQAAWSEVARRIAHEIKNPLTPIRLAAERIQRRAQALDPPTRDVVISGCEAIVAHVSGLKELVDAFHLYARMPTVSPRPASLNRLLREVASLYDGLRPGVRMSLELPPEEITALVDPALLRQALVNLLDNASEAIAESGEISLKAETAGASAVITVDDTGIGLPTDDLEVLTQPFFSTKGRGSGMGLALVRRIVSDHGGAFEISNRSPQGTRARVILRDAVVGVDHEIVDS